MKILFKKFKIMFYFLLMISCFSSCVFVNSPFDIVVYEKSPIANYGKLAVYIDGKIYFGQLSKIFTLNTSDDSIKSVGKTSGTLFCVDNNLAYFIERKNDKIKITSRI